MTTLVQDPAGDPLDLTHLEHRPTGPGPPSRSCVTPVCGSKNLT